MSRGDRVGTVMLLPPSPCQGPYIRRRPLAEYEAGQSEVADASVSTDMGTYNQVVGAACQCQCGSLDTASFVSRQFRWPVWLDAAAKYDQRTAAC